jgi:glycosyltransferase involved in cell wall biosynthesis
LVTVLERTYEEVLARIIAKKRVRVIAGNSLTKAWLEQRGVPSDAIGLTENGPSFQTRFEASDLFARDPFLRALDGRKFVLFCGRLTNLKGAADLPAIIHHVLGAVPEVAIVLCGGETDQSRGVHRAVEPFERNGSVKFLGFVSEPVKAWLFQQAHVVIAPSYEEGWGITVADGLVSGCWVVTYDIPAVREASPEGPIFIPLGDVEAFSRATVACLRALRPPTRTADGDRGSWSRIANTELAGILRPLTGAQQTLVNPHG